MQQQTRNKPHPLAKQVIDEGIIKALEEAYPDQSPSIDTPDRLIWFQAGQVDVVRTMRHHHQRQQQTILNGENL